VPVLLRELVDLGALHGARHRAQLRGTTDERGRRGGRTLPLDLNLGVGVETAEGFRPQRHEIVEAVRSDAGEVAAHSRRRLVGGQCRVQLGRLCGDALDDADRQDQQPREGPHQGTTRLHPLVSFAGVVIVARPCFAPIKLPLRLCYQRDGSRNRPPTPLTVSTPGTGSRAAVNLPRRRATWTSTVRGSTRRARPHTASRISSLPNTRPGAATRMASSSNSLGVSSTARPFTRTSKRWRSISRSPAFSWVGRSSRPPRRERA